jgi:NADH-quinone oxidoreductase subunit G
MSGTLIRCAPGDEPAVIAELQNDADLMLDAGSVVLVGERLASVPGALSAVSGLIASTAARLAWVPRRAGDRAAVDAGCLPNLLPGGRPLGDAQARVDVAADWGADVPLLPGRDADAILAAAAAGETSGLLVGGVELDDFASPATARSALQAARFVVSLEVRHGPVTERADVVFPVAPVVEKSGTFVNWEGRSRPFPQVLHSTNALPDLRVLAGIAEEMGLDLGFRTVEQVAAEINELGPWDGSRASMTPGFVSDTSAAHGADEAVLATWKLLIDDGRMQDGDDAYRATARRPVALVSDATYEKAGLGTHVTLATDLGAVTLPVAVADLPDGVVWAPSNSGGTNLARELGAGYGSVVRLSNGGAA